MRKKEREREVQSFEIFCFDHSMEKLLHFEELTKIGMDILAPLN